MRMFPRWNRPYCSLISNGMDEPQKPGVPAEQGNETVPKEQYYRLAADFDNYRKRMEQELADIVKFSGMRVVQEVVDTMDHLDAAVRHAADEIRRGEWFRGLEQVDKQFLETMKKFGVERISTVGQRFDPALMEAVGMVPGGESHVVKEEVRPGYKMHERVIRAARVIIYE